MKFLSTLLLLISLIAIASANFSAFKFTGCTSPGTIGYNECGTVCGTPAKITDAGLQETDLDYIVTYYTDSSCTTLDIVKGAGGVAPLVCSPNGEKEIFDILSGTQVECSSATTVFASIVLIAASLLFALL